MRFLRRFCLILFALLLVQMAVPAVSATEEVADISVSSGCRGIDAAIPILGSAQFTENAQSIVMYEATTDTLMYTWNPDQQLHPAGMVKIMTALIAIEKGTMTDVVTVQQSVLETVSSDARTSDLQTDEVLTVEQLIYCVLVEGSNDASAVLAHHIAGSQESFVALMNEYSAQLGCTDTVFTNVHGLHDERQLSTARDIARILDIAIENETFKAIFGTTHYTVEKTNKSEARDLESGNHMMHEGMYEIYYDERVTGGRTGVNNTGLRCIATTSKQEDMELICVVMGSESVINDRGIVEKIGGFEETEKLLDMGFDGFETAQVLYENQALKQYEVRNGSADVVVGPGVSISSVVPAGATADTFTYRYTETEGAFTAPVEKGRHMSKVEIWHGNVCIAQADLYALNEVSVNYQQIIEKENKGVSAWVVVLIVLVALFIVGFAVLYFIRLQNMRQRKASRSRKIKRFTKRRREM